MQVYQVGSCVEAQEDDQFVTAFFFDWLFLYIHDSLVEPSQSKIYPTRSYLADCLAG
jgi:hypothetical protein